MGPNNKMKFGVFMAPFHRVGENPTLALDRDLELIQWLDVLGFDEALHRRTPQRRLGNHRVSRGVHRHRC